MNVPTDDPDRHRIMVGTHRGKVHICEYVSTTPGELVAGPTVRIILTRDEALRVADGLVDTVEYAEHHRPATAGPLTLTIAFDKEQGPTRRMRKRRKPKGEQ